MATWFQWPDLPIRINERGEWLHGDEPLHPRVTTLFARNVLPKDDNSGYAIVLGYARHDVEVSDTPYWVRRMDAQADDRGRLRQVLLHLSDGTTEVLDGSTLMQGPEPSNAFYCRIVRAGKKVPCRFTSAQYHALMVDAEVDAQERVVLLLDGHAYPVGAYQGLGKA